MGNRNPVTLVRIVVSRNSAVVRGNLCEANIPPTAIRPLPMAISEIMTCKRVNAGIDIPRIMTLSRCCGPVLRYLRRTPRPGHLCIHDALAALALPQSEPGLTRLG